MAKKKKTRKQKILADTRHKILQAQYAQVYAPIEKQTEYRPQKTYAIPIANSDYIYVYSDLVKTIILTFSIITGELILRYLFF